MRILKSSAGLLRPLESRYRRFATHRAYDTVMRLPLLAWAVVLSTVQFAGILTAVEKPGVPVDSALMVNIAARVATFLFILSIAMLAVCRSRPLQKAPGLEPRLSALLGGLLSTAFVLFQRHELSIMLSVLSTLMVLLGNTLAVFVIWRLGRSFSVMAEARQLVTSGVYRFVRHPLYLAEEIAIIGIFMQFASVWTTLLLVAQLAFQFRRMGNEEEVLTATFPEYGSYRSQTARIVPGVY